VNQLWELPIGQHGRDAEAIKRACTAASLTVNVTSSPSLPKIEASKDRWFVKPRGSGSDEFHRTRRIPQCSLFCGGPICAEHDRPPSCQDLHFETGLFHTSGLPRFTIHSTRDEGIPDKTIAKTFDQISRPIMLHISILCTILILSRLNPAFSVLLVP